ncbi:hypothetical protein FS749_004273, partial [Ceratobasidium sp. UAMH 11750]
FPFLDARKPLTNLSSFGQQTYPNGPNTGALSCNDGHLSSATSRQIDLEHPTAEELR